MQYLYTATDDVSVSLRASYNDIQVMLKAVEAASNMDEITQATYDLDHHTHTLQRLDKELTKTLNDIGADLKIKSDNISLTYGELKNV